MRRTASQLNEDATMMKLADARAAPATRKRGRPTAETPEEKLARLEREITATRAAMREAEKRRFAVIGEAVAAEAEENPALRAQLADILTRRVTSAAARADIAAFIIAGQPAPADMQPGSHQQGEAA
jgi:hypothetical protein